MHGRKAIAAGLSVLVLTAVLQVASATPSVAATFSETVGGDAHTWTNYTNAGGTQGPTIPAFTTVQITCALNGFQVSDGNTWWYQIASSPWNNVYYVSADAFYNNGATSGSLHGTPFVDPAVPLCGRGGTNETTGGAANTWTNYTNAGGTQGPTIAGNQTVQIACALSGFQVADGNTWWYQIASSPWNNAYYVSADAFYNNGATSGSLHGTPFVDPAVPQCATGPGGGGPGGPTETNGGAANTWANYTNAGGSQGPTIPAFTAVQITCKVSGFTVADGNTWWYQIGSSPWNNTFYVSADAFYNNGRTSGSLLGTPFVDSAVPDCSTGARPSGETAGGPAQTWANYSHAGGTQGPTIPAFATVQVSCRVTGFAVANGNTWWYLVTSAPWNNVYYVSADAFYNNGATSGPLAGTPFVDPAVPVCVNNREAPIFGTAVGSSQSSSHASVNSPSCVRADPVNCASGDFWESATDISVPGRGPGLNLTRTYNDLNAASAGLFGNGWTSTYDQHLTLNSDGSITVTLDDGSQLVAEPDGSGGFIVPASANSTLQANPDGTYTLAQRAARFLTFSATGQLLSLRDRNGYQTSLIYNASHQLTTVTDAAGRALHVTVGANGLVASVADPLGRTYGYTYDSAGNLSQVTEPTGGFFWLFSYDSSHRMLTMADRRGGVVTNVYDTQGRVTSQTDPAGKTTKFAYTGDNFSSLGGTTTITDPRNMVEVEQYANGFMTKDIRASGTSLQAMWSYTYDPSTFGPTSTTDPKGNVTTRTYDAAGNLLTTVDPLGRTTTNAYNALNEPLSVTDALGATTTHTYDANGNQLTTTGPLADTTTSTYGDSAHPGDLTAVTDPDGRVTRHSYDTNGDVISTAVVRSTTATDTTGFSYDADGEQVCKASANATAAGIVCPAAGSPRRAGTISTVYDALGELTSVTDANGHTTSYVYDPNGNRSQATDPTGNITTYTYDADNRLTRTTQANGAANSTTYDSNGNVAWTTDPNGHQTTKSYDALNRMLTETNPVNKVVRFAYDADGNRTSLTDASGRVTTYGYDADNELTAVSYSDGVTHGVTYAYDADGRRTSMSDGSGTTTYTYDARGRITASTDGAGHVVRHTYDLAGHPTSITYPNGKTVSNSYDGAGNLISVTDWLGHKTSFTYDRDTNLVSETTGSSPAVTDIYKYDAADNLVSVSDTLGTTTLQAFTYTRNADDLVATAVRAGNPTITYAYDKNNQLTSDDQGPYTYDLAGNATHLINTTPLSYDAGDELVAKGTGTTAIKFTFDAQGNRTANTPPGVAATTYGYDQVNRLTHYQSGATTASYAYNGDGLRTSKTVGATVTSFAWDASVNLPTLLADSAASYIYGPGGLPLESINTAGTPTFLHHDQLGNTTMLTSLTGAKITAYSYGSYGTVGFGDMSATPLLYGGQYRDAETGLYYLRARYYDPTTAQFLSVDPALAATKMPFSYATNDPINDVDLSGKFSLSKAINFIGDFVPFGGVAKTVGSYAGSVVVCFQYGQFSPECDQAQRDTAITGALTIPGSIPGAKPAIKLIAKGITILSGASDAFDLVGGNSGVATAPGYSYSQSSPGPGCGLVSQASPLSAQILFGVSPYLQG